MADPHTTSRRHAEGQRPRLRTEVRDVNGVPRLLINGLPHSGIFCSVQPEYMRNFIDAGFDIFDTHPLTPHGWVGENQYDYTETDARIERYLSQKPDALLILRFWMEYDQANPRPWYGLWWQEQHAEERASTSSGPMSGHLRSEPSFASLRWRESAGEALRRVIAHVEGKYGDNVVGYVPGGGPCGEWFNWFCYGAKFGPDHLDDYSPRMLEMFLGELRAKYTDVKRLNESWGTRYGRFGEVPLPSAESRNAAMLGNLRDAQLERPVLDFLEIYNRQTADTLIHFAKMVKFGCDRRKVVMAFYGYLWHHQHNVIAVSRSGHLHLGRVLACPDIDYIVSPFHYSFRQVGGVISGQAPVTPAIRAGKQFVHELDGSTNLKPSWPSPKDNVPRDAKETGELLKRDLARTITQGASAWYMDLMTGMYDSPEVVAEIKKVLEVGREHALLAGRGNRQVAVVLRPEDISLFRENEPLLTPLVSMFKQFQLERMGLGYDEFLVSELERLSLDAAAQYRFWVFPTLVGPTDAELNAIRSHCCRNGNQVLFNYGVGVCHGKGVNLGRMREITGFDCGYTLEAGELAVGFERPDTVYLDGVKTGSVYGTYGDLSPETIRHHIALKQYPEKFEITPRFWIKSGGEILGRTIDYGEAPRGGFAIGPRDGWTSVLSVAPLLPREILRNIARAASCHVYTDFPGQVFHCENYLGMYFHAAGDCTFTLPNRSTVTDVFTGRVVAKNVSQFTVNASASTTVLYKVDEQTP